MLTKPDDIEQNLYEGYDPDYYSSVFLQLKYAFGEPWGVQDQGAVASDGGFPYFPSIRPHFFIPGQSRRIINTQFLVMAKVMAQEPEPEYPTLDPMDAEARKGFLLARYRGDGYGNPNWAEQEAQAYIEGDGTGIGFLKLGLKTGPGGYQMVAARHSPSLLTMGDWHYRSPDEWRWVCFVEYIPEDIALKQFGDAAKPFVRPIYDGAQQRPAKAVRVFDYWDVGMADSEPTRAFILGDMTNKPVKREANKLRCLPFSWCMHFFAPEMKRPVGRIILQMATQEALNEVEEHMRQTMLIGKGFDVADPGQYHPQDLRDVRSGKTPKLVRRTRARQQGEEWERVAPMELSSSTIQHLRNLSRQFNEDSGIPDWERSNQSPERRTATEVNIMDERSAAPRMWSMIQGIKLRERTFEKAAKIAALYDRDPVLIDFLGGRVMVNEPGSALTAEAICKEPAKPLISEDNMTYQDLRTKRARRMQELMAIFPQVQLGLFSAQWWATEMAKAIGEKELRKVLGPLALQTGPTAQQPPADMAAMMGALGGAKPQAAVA